MSIALVRSKPSDDLHLHRRAFQSRRYLKVIPRIRHDLSSSVRDLFQAIGIAYLLEANLEQNPGRTGSVHRLVVLAASWICEESLQRLLVLTVPRKGLLPRAHFDFAQ